MAELADAQGLGPCVLMDVWVRLPPLALTHNSLPHKDLRKNGGFLPVTSYCTSTYEKTRAGIVADDAGLALFITAQLKSESGFITASGFMQFRPDKESSDEAGCFTTYMEPRINTNEHNWLCFTRAHRISDLEFPAASQQIGFVSQTPLRDTLHTQRGT